MQSIAIKQRCASRSRQCEGRVIHRDLIQTNLGQGCL